MPSAYPGPGASASGWPSACGSRPWAPCSASKAAPPAAAEPSIVPMDEINLHFTGDIHAVGAAHNLLAAMIDNHIHHGNELDIDPKRVLWPRVMDMNDRQLRHVVVGLGGRATACPRETRFDITVASEVMAILCLADGHRRSEGAAGPHFDRPHLRRRARVRPGPGRRRAPWPRCWPRRSSPTWCRPWRASRPSSTAAPSPTSPTATTHPGHPARPEGGRLRGHRGRVRGGPGRGEVFRHRPRLQRPDARRGGSGRVGAGAAHARRRAPADAARSPTWRRCGRGLANLDHHVRLFRHFGLPMVVAINRFDGDPEEELEPVAALLRGSWAFPAPWPPSSRKAARAAKSWPNGAGDAGGAETAAPWAELRPPTTGTCPLREKIEILARDVYGADGVDLHARGPEATSGAARSWAWRDLPVCMAKTQHSIYGPADAEGRAQGLEA